MRLPTQPVTLSVEQIGELNQRLSTMRHDINNQLSLIAAASEILRFNTDMAGKMALTLSEQPPKITEKLSKFSAELEAMLGITRL